MGLTHRVQKSKTGRANRMSKDEGPASVTRPGHDCARQALCVRTIVIMIVLQRNYKRIKVCIGEDTSLGLLDPRSLPCAIAAAAARECSRASLLVHPLVGLRVAAVGSLGGVEAGGLYVLGTKAFSILPQVLSICCHERHARVVRRLPSATHRLPTPRGSRAAPAFASTCRAVGGCRARFCSPPCGQGPRRSHARLVKPHDIILLIH